MAIGARLTVAEQLSRNPAFKGRPLALEIRDAASGRLLRASEALMAGAKGIGGVMAAAASRALAIIKPEMITSDRLSFNIMKNPVTVAMFRQFVEDEAGRPEGYRIKGYNADELTALLADVKKSDHALTYVSYNDATAFAKWRKEKTGQDLRIPSEEEWLAAKNAVGNQLKGGLWEWTKTIYSGTARILRSLSYFNQDYGRPEDRSNNVTVRFVEDKK